MGSELQVSRAAVAPCGAYRGLKEVAATLAASTPSCGGSALGQDCPRPLMSKCNAGDSIELREEQTAISDFSVLYGQLETQIRGGPQQTRTRSLRRAPYFLKVYGPERRPGSHLADPGRHSSLWHSRTDC
jgi:hypothetical protein